jgi:hypothetical protein
MLDHSHYVLWNNEIRYEEPFSRVCYPCHVPQANDTLHKTFVHDQSACEYPSILSPLAYGVWYSEKLRPRAQARFAMAWKDQSEYLKWINGPTVEGHLTNLSAIFLWYAQEVDT